MVICSHKFTTIVKMRVFEADGAFSH